MTKRQKIKKSTKPVAKSSGWLPFITEVKIYSDADLNRFTKKAERAYRTIMKVKDVRVRDMLFHMIWWDVFGSLLSRDSFKVFDPYKSRHAYEFFRNGTRFTEEDAKFRMDKDLMKNVENELVKRFGISRKRAVSRCAIREAWKKGS